MFRLSARNTEKLALVVIWIGGAVTVSILLLIIGYVLIQGLPEISWSFLTTAPKGGLDAEGGISTIIVSTIYLIGLTMAILIPLGIGSAIYLAEYAKDNNCSCRISRCNFMSAT